MDQRQLPEIDLQNQLTSQRPAPPSYVTSGAAAVQAQNAGQIAAAPTLPQDDSLLIDLPCLTNGKGEQLPRDFIEKWRFTENNKERRLEELVYTIKLLRSKKPTELVTEPLKYSDDFR